MSSLGTELGRLLISYHTCSLMANGKLLGERLREFQKLHDVSLRSYREVNMEFRTMDKDINTVRPELMKLQWEKRQYTRYVATLVSRLSPSTSVFIFLYFTSNHAAS